MKSEYWTLFVGMMVMIIGLSACRKDPTTVGFEIQPTEEQIELYGDDSTVLSVSYTTLFDSVVTSNLATLVLGSLDDPIFGTTQAAFNTQMLLGKVDPILGNDIRFDSICLYLGYSGQWGDSTTLLTAHVYQLTDSLWLNSDTTLGATRSNYYATDQVAYDPVPLGSKTFLSQPYDSVSFKRSFLKRITGMHAPLLSIRLDDEFGKKLLADSASFVTNADFLQKYYGLRVAVDPVTGPFGKMLYFSTASTETKLVLYYTNSDSSTYLNFPINDKCVRFNNYEINHATASADLQNQLNNPSPESGNQRLFIQPLDGTRIKVDFSGIDKLRDKKLVINEAKLFLNNAAAYDKNLPPPTQLIMYTVDANGKTTVTPDGELGTGYSGGTFDASKNRYVFRITSYLQKRLANPSMDDDNLYISISGASFVANRVELYGNNPDDAPDEKVKIRILMSEY